MHPLSWRHRLLVHRLTDHLVEVSSGVLEADRESFGLKTGQLTWVEAAVDLNRFRPHGGAAARASLGIGEEETVVGIVARVQRHRRFEVLFQGFQGALRVRPDLRLLIVGRGTHFDEVAREPIEGLGIRDRVVLAGYRGDDYPDVLSCFDMKVFLVPGTDGSCRAVRQAMASGIPVIASRRGMLPEILEEGTGFLIEDTAEGLTEAILRLACDDVLRQRLSSGARRVAERRFDPAVQVRKIEAVYGEALEVARRRAGGFAGTGGRAKNGGRADSAGEADPPACTDSGHCGEETGECDGSGGKAEGESEKQDGVDLIPDDSRPSVDVSVVVVNWNGRHLLAECLASVERGARTLTTEVILVDNGSKDGSVEYVRDQWPEVILVENASNRGFGAANNQAFRKAAGKALLLLNTDARLRPGTLNALVNFLDTHPDAGGVTPALIDEAGKAQNAFDNFPTLASELLNKNLLRALFPDRYPSKRMEITGPLEVESAIGACFLLRREALAKAGPFDEGFFLFLEETDLCLRIRAAGFGIHFLPTVTAMHLGGGSKAHAPAEAWIEYYRSLYRYFHKHAPPWAYTTLRLGRFLKLVMNTAGTFLLLFFLMGMHDKAIRKFPVYLKLLWWHLLLCPEDRGLRPKEDAP
jgi:GT2 family glycosyltransferase